MGTGLSLYKEKKKRQASRGVLSSDADLLYDIRHLTQKTSPSTPHQGWLQTVTRPGLKAPPWRPDATLLFPLDSCSSRAEKRSPCWEQARGLAPFHRADNNKNKGRGHFDRAAADTLLICLFKRGRGSARLFLAIQTVGFEGGGSSPHLFPVTLTLRKGFPLRY